MRIVFPSYKNFHQPIPCHGPTIPHFIRQPQVAVNFDALSGSGLPQGTVAGEQNTAIDLCTPNARPNSAPFQIWPCQCASMIQNRRRVVIDTPPPRSGTSRDRTVSIKLFLQRPLAASDFAKNDRGKPPRAKAGSSRPPLGGRIHPIGEKRFCRQAFRKIGEEGSGTCCRAQESARGSLLGLQEHEAKRIH